MTDFTYEWFQACGNITLYAETPSSRGKEIYETMVSVDEQPARCSCPGFTFHRHCKHVDQLRLKLCGWSSQLSEEVQTPEQEMKGICPKCGAPTQTYKAAV